MRLPASPPSIASRTRPGSVLIDPASVRASATISSVPMTTSWLQAFAIWPEPSGPIWTIAVANAARTMRAASRSAASPPTISARVPSIAACSPPDIGASSGRPPASRTRRPIRDGVLWCDRRQVDDDRSRADAAGLIIPATTEASTSVASGGRERIMSVTSATSAAWRRPANSPRRALRLGRRADWTTRSIRHRRRCVTIGLPMTPRPIMPTTAVRPTRPTNVLHGQAGSPSRAAQRPELRHFPCRRPTLELGGDPMVDEQDG